MYRSTQLADQIATALLAAVGGMRNGGKDGQSWCERPGPDDRRDPAARGERRRADPDNSAKAGCRGGTTRHMDEVRRHDGGGLAGGSRQAGWRFETNQRLSWSGTSCPNAESSKSFGRTAHGSETGRTPVVSIPHCPGIIVSSRMMEGESGHKWKLQSGPRALSPERPRFRATGEATRIAVNATRRS